MISEKSVYAFCLKNEIPFIENYDKAINDTTQMYELHHRNEITEHKTSIQLKNEGRYYQLHASELIFLTKTEHRKLHAANILNSTRQKLSDASKNHIVSEETREKLRIANTGENNPQYGKCGELHWNYGKHHSEETKRKISIAEKGQQPWNKGIPCSEKAKNKLRKYRTGMFVWNNGVVNKFAKDCPGPEWKRGRLKHD